MLDRRPAVAILVVSLMVASLIPGGLAWGAGSSSSKSRSDKAAELYQEGMELVKAGRYEEARKRFEKARDKSKKDPDTLNMLAFTQRKTGQLEKAFENYERALKRRPRFPEAREYLGEAHLAAALRQVEELRSYGAEGEAELAQLIAAFKQAAASLEDASDSPEREQEAAGRGW